MIEVSKSETLKHDLNLTNVNLSVLLEKLIQRQIFLIEDKNLKTELKIDKGINIVADEEKYQGLLIILLIMR